MYYTYGATADKCGNDDVDEIHIGHYECGNKCICLAQDDGEIYLTRRQIGELIHNLMQWK